VASFLTWYSSSPHHRFSTLAQVEFIDSPFSPALLSASLSMPFSGLAGWNFMEAAGSDYCIFGGRMVVKAMYYTLLHPTHVTATHLGQFCPSFEQCTIFLRQPMMPSSISYKFFCGSPHVTIITQIALYERRQKSTLVEFLKAHLKTLPKCSIPHLEIGIKCEGNLSN
jgi:hypothetical protein